jgi:hypothetical protein
MVLFKKIMFIADVENELCSNWGPDCKNSDLEKVNRVIDYKVGPSVLT